jgi:hypothetical protein
MSERLEYYINSNRKLLPRDINLYNSRRGGEKSHLCLFCEITDHDNIPIYEYSKNNAYTQTRSITDCYMCHSCDELLEMHFLDRDNQTGDGDFIDDIDYLDSPPSLKLTEYISKGRFNEDVHSYYFFLNPEIDKYTTDYILATCYFCGTNNLSNHALLEVPVDSHYNVVGGHIKLCHDCLFIIDKSKTVDNEVHDLCAKCNKHYIITFEELDFRKSENSMGLHTCPLCTHTNIHNYHKSPIKALRSNFSKTIDLIPVRMLDIQCPCCTETVLLDVTIHEDIIKNVLCLNNIIVCSTCVQKFDKVVQVDAHLTIGIRSVGDNYVAELFQNNKFISVYHKDKSSSLLDIVTEILDLYYNTTKFTDSE